MPKRGGVRERFGGGPVTRWLPLGDELVTFDRDKVPTLAIVSCNGLIDISF